MDTLERDSQMESKSALFNPFQTGRKGLALILLVAGGLSLYLAMNRIYQVDEAQWAYSAWIQGAGLSHEHFTAAPLFLLPFGPLTGGASSAEQVFTIMRLGFWLLWWINLSLLSFATGSIPWSRRGMGVMLFALLLPPLWTYGLEVRHENVLLTGVLALWALGRYRGRRGWLRFLLMGSIAVAMQASTFKSLAYWLPLSLGFMVFPHPTHGSRTRLVGAWLLGAVIATGVIVALEKGMGFWPSFWAEQTGFLHGAGHVVRFSPGATLEKLGVQAGLVVAITLAFAWRFFMVESRPRDRSSLHGGPLPEILLAAGCCLLLLINPNPFPYNLLTVTVSLFLAAYALAWPMMTEASGVALAWTLSVAVVCAQAIPCGLKVSHLIEADNGRQVQLMEAAEALTDPVRDRVYDSCGLVPTRRSVGYVWFMNIANVDAFRDGRLTPFMKAFRETPPAVVIPTYRFSYLGKNDEAELERRYVGLAPDLWVAGHVFTQAEETWACFVEGRYLIKSLSPAGDGQILFDGAPLPDAPVYLRSGPHSIKAPLGARVSAVWVGPKLDDVPSLEGEPMPGVFPIPNAF